MAEQPSAGRKQHAERAVSFVLPAFNEAENIGTAVRRCVEVAERLGLVFEVIVVDDGSRDDTRAIVEGLAAADPRVRSLHHVRNRGYGAALKSGLFAARLDRVFFTDADLQFDVAEIARLLERADDYDIVAGYRAPRRDGWVRRFNGWAWTRLVDALFDVGVRDVDCAFKIFDRRIFERVPVYSIGAFVNTEILVRARAEGFTVCEVPVTHFAREAGVQTGANPRVIVKALAELASLRAELRALPAARRELGALRERQDR
jgi:glycosyltransferase involved in cell wall biosynthesis